MLPFSESHLLIYHSTFLQQEIQDVSYGQDVSSVEQLYKEHQSKHEEIMKLREDVEKACKSDAEPNSKQATAELKQLFTELVVSFILRVYKYQRD